MGASAASQRSLVAGAGGADGSGTGLFKDSDDWGHRNPCAEFMVSMLGC